MTFHDDIRPRQRRPDRKGPSRQDGDTKHRPAAGRIRLDGTGSVTHREPALSETPVRRPSRTPHPERPSRPPRHGAPVARGTRVRTPGWKLLTRGAVGAALVVGLAAQVSGEGGEIRSDVTAQVAAAREALDEARGAFAEGDLIAAEDSLGVAQHSLHEANQSVAELGQQGGVPFSQAAGDRTVAVELLSTGERFVTTARDVVREVRTIPEAAAADDEGFYATGRLLNERLPAIRDDFSELDRELDLLAALSDRAADSGIDQLREAGTEFRRILPDAKQALAYGTEVEDQLPGILGQHEFRRYLLWFQNPAELRPTGGFIGTLGVLTLDRGAVKNLEVDSIYAVANQANRTIEEPPPAPFVRFAEEDPPVWALQNANWSPDFPTSAKRFQDFYEEGGGSTTDGVIALTVTPIEEMLRVLGPVELPEYGYTLTADNFQTTIQDDQKERRAAEDKDPKKILRDFVPALLKKLGTAPDEQRTKALAALTGAAASGDIQLFFNRDRHEQLLGNAKAAGTHRPYAGGIGLVDANIAGFKSSRDVSTEIVRTVKVGADGATTESVEVAREHSGETETRDNLNYARLYLPPRAEPAPAGNADGGGDWSAATTGWNASELSDEIEGWGAVLGGWTDIARFDGREYRTVFRHGDPLDLREGRLPLRYVSQVGTAVRVKTVVTLPDGYVWDGRDGATVEGRRITLDDTARGDLVYDLTFRPVGD